MKIVIDFSGYYNRSNKFEIKEFCMCRLFNSTVINKPVIIIKDPLLSIPLQSDNNSYKDFIDKFGIRDTRSSYKLNQLRQKVKRVINKNSKTYVRNGEQLIKLISFINDSNFNCNKIKLLSDIGFPENYELTKTNCPYHINKANNYCAGDNARLMADWLVYRKWKKRRSRRNMQLVINFSGYYDYDTVFRIKELSIRGLSNDGNIIYHKLYVTKPEYDSSSSINEIVKNKFNDIYYDEFGIKYEDGNYELLRLNKKISKILNHYDIKTIYVKNYNYYNLLNKIVANIKQFDVICLEECNYVENNDINFVCQYHTHEDINKNVCVDNSGMNMVNWIISNEFYKYEVRGQFFKIKLSEYIDDELVNKFIIDGNNELPVLSSDDLE
ncbi:uncharacterized LOC106693329 [Microplitis demolitor]|uniref:uncharacterized LOC106693329 n=1 Tax=Microplitis demolitor TaxID=69319 RepID=UPI0006D4F318|nr:uncharacterized LOC106693329 [Microplitis demolitor]